MATYALKDCKLYLDGLDISGYTNNININAEKDAVDNSVFGTGTKLSIPGLDTVKIEGKGFNSYSSDNIDAELWTDFAVSDKPVSACVTDGTIGSLAYSINGLSTAFAQGAAVGDAVPYALSSSPSGAKLIRATVMETGAKTVSASGTVRQLSTASATQKLYALIHCTAFNATSLDVLVKSDDGAGFASPVTRVTYTQITGVGSQWVEVSGAITDDYYRVDWTLVGTSATFHVLLAIQ